MRGSRRPNKTAIYWPPLLWPSALCLSRSPDAQPEARELSFLLSACFLYHILSPTGLASKLTGDPKGRFCRVVAFSTTSCFQLLWSPTQSGVPKAPSAVWWLSLPQLFSNSSGPQLPDFLLSSNYIIVQSPTQSLKGMFDRHQAEITVMQFTCHSLPVHQSMSVPWDFYLVPYFGPPAYAIFSHNCHRNVSLPSGASLWNGMFGLVEGQCTTIVYAVFFFC